MSKKKTQETASLPTTPDLNFPQNDSLPNYLPVVQNFIDTPIYSPDPMRMTCLTCRQDIVTVTVPEAGLLTWLLCGGLTLMGCFWGPCLYPFCIEETKDVIHECPNCQTSIGMYKRIGG
ncbi:hypothetical protein B4U79_08630 [Dinothrombium tinctorium]|uniref:LITAF domain-containing protein n=1 Tax=Dinothrombium tinctorium TaxID=1965070 RepID=A0A3S3PHJ7_9ACAR|nr:hypothetical protein B4U79_08630 [Dinothrombium tinctorium]